MATKQFKALHAPNIRVLLAQANELDITKEDIVSLVREGELFILVYFK